MDCARLSGNLGGTKESQGQEMGCATYGYESDRICARTTEVRLTL